MARHKKLRYLIVSFALAGMLSACVGTKAQTKNKHSHLPLIDQSKEIGLLTDHLLSKGRNFDPVTSYNVTYEHNCLGKPILINLTQSVETGKSQSQVSSIKINGNNVDVKNIFAINKKLKLARIVTHTEIRCSRKQVQGDLMRLSILYGFLKPNEFRYSYQNQSFVFSDGKLLME